jgi:chromosome segregation ATPase
VCLKLASKSTVELVPEQVEEKIKRLVEVSRRVNEVNEELVGVDELLGVINQRISSLEGEIDAFKKERAGILARQEELRQKLPDAKMLKRIEAFKKVLE